MAHDGKTLDNVDFFNMLYSKMQTPEGREAFINVFVGHVATQLSVSEFSRACSAAYHANYEFDKNKAAEKAA